MDGFLRKHLSRLAGLGCALLALVSLLTFHAQDPTLTNLRYPKDGVGNWLGYPGALAGGSLVEGFGLAALLLPLLIANAFLTPRNRPAPHRYALHGGALLLTAATVLGLGPDDPTLGLRGPGLIGWTAGRWVLATAGLWPGVVLLTLAGAYAAAHLVYAPQVWRAVADVRTLGRFGLRQLGARLLERWRALRPQTGWAWHELALLPFTAAAICVAWLWERGVRRAFLRPVAVALQGWRERRYSVARVKSGPAAPVLPPAQQQQEPAPRYRPPVDAPMSDGFAQWLEQPEPVVPVAATPPTVPAPRPAAQTVQSRGASPPGELVREEPTLPPQAALPPLPTDAGGPAAGGPAAGGERVARWEEYLRRYQENLDLDWDERSWKRKRLEELAQEREDEPPSAAPSAPARAPRDGK